MSIPNEHLLSGYRILDFTRALAGPSCTRMFAEMGAEVIKVEAAPSGDLTRAVSKLLNDRSLYYVQQNLNKKSLCVDLRKPAGMALIRELVPHCDVVVENFRPGVMAGMGLGYEALQALRPDIILCSISALGQKGPLSGKPGYDFIAQAYAGVTSMIGEADQPPYIPLLGIGDVSTGVHGAFAVAAALLHRGRTGRGQHLDIALLDCYYHYHEVNVHTYSATGGATKPTRCGRHLSYVSPAGVFAGTGGDVMIMAFLHHWADLCAAMGREDLVQAVGWATDAERLARQDEVVALIEGWLKGFADVGTAVAKLEEHGVPCAPVLSVAETVEHPHLVARGTVRTINDPVAGEFKVPGMPIRTSDYPYDADYVAPTLGQHNGAVLADVLGKDAEEIARLETDGVLQSGDF
ncbi:MAG: CoA transferase [Gammaproteobacteria bacterium]|nr:CoA transferase [Gammaproteobacteria bacterium]MCP5198803.1 CoA transferase [Gammaproteobacteria bacterium]